MILNGVFWEIIFWMVLFLILKVVEVFYKLMRCDWNFEVIVLISFLMWFLFGDILVFSICFGYF